MSSSRLSIRRLAGTTFTLLLLTSGAAAPAADGTTRGLILRVPKPYDRVVQAVRGLGGEVNHQYENVDAIAVNVPEERVSEILALVGPGKASKDPMIAQPHSIRRDRGEWGNVPTVMEAGPAQALDEAGLKAFAAALPNDYSFNNVAIGASTLHAAGYLGQGMTVAIIDSGTANSPVVPALAGRVMGGESFVPADPVPSATSRRNGPHGTWVGTVIGGNVVFGYSSTSAFVSSLEKFAPSALYGPCPASSTYPVCWVPQVGVAPLSRLYALKVFDSRGGGSPESRIIAAMDRAITLRRNYNQGVPVVPVNIDGGTEDNPYVYDSLNIQVVNMSLGGGTLFAGRDLEDQLTVKMLKEGMVLTTSAGNDGFGAMTGGSPGSGLGSLTVGASSNPAHERIVADLFFVPGAGELYRPTSHVQTASFSSRGPTADGRYDPDLVANGDWTWAQGTCQGSAGCLAGTAYATTSFVSGTSFSAPTVAGAAALLRQRHPDSSAAQIRNAIISSANPRFLGDRSGRIDQGKGYLDVAAAAERLPRCVPDRIEKSHPSPFVEKNIERLGFRPVRFVRDSFTTHVRDLVPGQVAQFFVESDPDTDELQVDLTSLTPELPPAQQNQLFGDDVYFKIVDAPTSYEDRNVTEFVGADRSFVFDNPQTGLVRVALQGDWTNAGKVSADLTIRRVRSRAGRASAHGTIREGDLVPLEVGVPAGTLEARFETHFLRSWAYYPTSDIDMLLVDPDGAVSTVGSTLSSPERVVVHKPTPGTWTVLVSAFALPAEPDYFWLYAKADGIRLRATR